MNAKPAFVRVAIENHNAIHGQFGNIRQSIRQLQRLLIDNELGEYVAEVEKIHEELRFLEKYYPPHSDNVPFD